MSQPSTNGLNADINHFGIISGSSAATGVTDINYHSNSFENDGLNTGFTPSISTSSTEYDEQDQSYEGGFDPTIGPTDSSDGNNNNNNNNNNNENINTNNNLIDGVAVWQPDEDVTNCCICHSSFTFFHRKHHCRKCGRIVCGDCSSVFTNYLPLTYVVCPPSQVFLESPHVPHRTCDDCVDELDMIRRALRRNNAPNVLNSPGNNSNNISGGSTRFSDNASTVLPPEIAKNVKDITHRTTTLLLDDESRTNSSSRSSIRDFNRQIGVMSPILTQRNNSTSNKNNGSSNANINTTNSGSGNSNNNSNGISTSDQDTDMDLCPICAKNLKSLSEEKKEKHIDDCLTSAEFSGSPDTKRHFNRMLVYNIPLPLSEKGRIKSILKNKTITNSSNTNTPISSLNPKEPIPDYMISRVLDIPNGSNRDGSISSSSENGNLKAVNGVNSGSMSTVRVSIGSNNTNKSSCIDGSSLNKIVGGSSLDTINNNSGQITTGFSDEVHSDYNIDEIISPPTGDNNHTSSSKYESDHEDEEGKDEDEDEDDDDYPECVICFEPLKPGDKVGRLECLCVFHYKCIKGWFERKGASECPVHAIHMN
ncbi:hypothetical protein BVG19_g2149 [[Candida] boidinii]|nr:hypothetical protein BVG19_g2149 [[Candida] boidinii]OWB51808.1 hypothetical protein B5S27_g3376 [[Candida] boidinii]OWB82235.1 hypothetical protein B5S33_g859 [[Candida] boidinii]